MWSWSAAKYPASATGRANHPANRDVEMGNRVDSQELRRFVVRVDSEDRQPQGTGFFVAPGWVLTCAHVVRQPSALQAARDQLITAQGIDPTNNDTADGGQVGALDRLGAIGRAVLATLLPARRLRYSNRNVKCTTSRYHARKDGRPALPTSIAAIDIAVHTPPLHPTPSARPLHPFRHRPPAPSKPSTPPVPTRRQLVTAILLSQPRRDWHGWELTEKLQIKQHNLLTSYLNGPAWASSVAPAPAPTPSTPHSRTGPPPTSPPPALPGP